MADPPGELTRSAGRAGAATLTSRILGLVRDQVLAATFGAGNEMDAFVVAWRVPNLVRDLFVEGAMSAAFVPTFSRHLATNGRADAWRLGNQVLTATVLATLIVVGIGLAFTWPIVGAIAGDFARVPGKLELTVRLSRLMLPFLPLVALAAVLMGMLNSLQHFFVPALAPAAYNVAMILGAIALVPVMPAFGLPGITALAIAALAGGAGQVALQWLPLRHEGFRYEFLLDLRDGGLRRVIALMGPGTVGLAATQVNLLVGTFLATSQGTGAASWLTYSFRLMYLPIGLIGVSIATAVLPVAARHVATGSIDGAREAVSRGLSMMLLVNVPATLGLVALASPIVRLIFERGEFLPADTAATATALQLYAIGLVGYSTARITSPVFYAVGRSHIPVAVSVGVIALNLIASLALVHVMGFAGLALATSLAALIHGGTSLLLLRRSLHGIDGTHLHMTAVKVLGASVLMAIVAMGVERELVLVAPGDGAIAQTVRLGGAIAAGVLVIAASARLLAIREFDEVLSFVTDRWQHR